MKKTILFLVDDDALFLKSLEVDFLQLPEYDVETYATGELCMENISRKPDIIILDYHLNGVTRDAMNGIDTLIKIKAYDADIPVIMLSAQDKIEVAINCMHNKAHDYVVKSETGFVRLQQLIPAIIKYKELEKKLRWYMTRM